MFAGMLERDRKRCGLRVCQAAWHLGVTVREYRELEAGTRFPTFEQWDRDMQDLRVVAELRGAPAVMDEDAELRTNLAGLGPGAMADLQRVLEESAEYRREILVSLMGRPGYSELATMIAMADTDEVVRLRLLQAIRRLDA